MEGLIDHPVRTELSAPPEVARWRPLFAWVLAIPHFIVLSVLSNVAGILVFIAWVAIVFTGRYPRGLFDFVAMYLRYQWRTLSYACGLHEAFPPFEFEMDADDDGHSPAVFAVEHPESLSRGLVWVRSFIVGTARWSNRTTAYLYLMTDVYPPYLLR